MAAGAVDAVTSDHHARGGNGALDLARAVIKAAEQPSEMRFLYPLEWSIKQKIEAIATQVYGADGVDYEPLAEQKIKLYTKLGYDKLPINMAKTHLSLSHDPTLKNRPRNFRLPIRDIRASVGAGFLYPLCGDMRTMPGLPKPPPRPKGARDRRPRRGAGTREPPLSRGRPRQPGRPSAGQAGLRPGRGHSAGGGAGTDPGARSDGARARRDAAILPGRGGQPLRRAGGTAALQDGKEGTRRSGGFLDPGGLRGGALRRVHGDGPRLRRPGDGRRDPAQIRQDGPLHEPEHPRDPRPRRSDQTDGG